MQGNSLFSRHQRPNCSQEYLCCLSFALVPKTAQKASGLKHQGCLPCGPPLSNQWRDSLLFFLINTHLATPHPWMFASLSVSVFTVQNKDRRARQIQLHEVFQLSAYFVLPTDFHAYEENSLVLLNQNNENSNLHSPGLMILHTLLTDWNVFGVQVFAETLLPFAISKLHLIKSRKCFQFLLQILLLEAPLMQSDFLQLKECFF